MTIETIIPSARAFVRSLNVLLRYARLYGMEHSRTITQLHGAWSELETALAAAGPAGLLLGASGSQLLLDGVPLETTSAERNFAGLLAAAGVASMCFNPALTQEQFAGFLRVFAQLGNKPAGLADQLKAALGSGPHPAIRVNEIRFVAEDAALADARVAAQITARSLGVDGEKLQAWLNDPQKLIQLIAAAEGAGRGSSAVGGVGLPTGAGSGAVSGAPATGAGPAIGASPGFAGGTAVTGSGSPSQPQRAPPLGEEDILGVFRLLSQLGAAGLDQSAADPAAWQRKIATLPAGAQVTLRQALEGMAAAAPSSRPDEPVLLKLAENLAIRFAMNRYERGEVRINAVRQLLDRMGKEIEALRKLLQVREDKIATAGLTVESHADILDRQFWAAVPDSGKRRILLSSEAWCIPSRNVQQFVEELLDHNDCAAAENILLQYAGAVRNKELQARRKAAIGMGQLAAIYGRTGSASLAVALRELGDQMAEEREPELQTLLSAAFVRFSQEAAAGRHFAAMRQALDSLDDAERVRPSWVQGLRPRIGVENRLPEFIEDALAAERAPDDLAEVLRRVPQAASEQLAAHLVRCVRHTERERLVELAQDLGEPCVERLREILRADPESKAVHAIGLLSRLDPSGVQALLPARLLEAQRPFHDAAVRQLATAGSAERGALLLGVLEILHPLVMPEALDEIGMSLDVTLTPALLRLVQGELPAGAPDLVRLKAIEALGRLRAPTAAEPLRDIVEARKQGFRWLYPRELRVAAMQALEKLDPDWSINSSSPGGLDDDELALTPCDVPIGERFVRLRRYPRMHVSRPLAAAFTTPRGRYTGTIKLLSLQGGLAVGDLQIPVGTEATLKLGSGLRAIMLRVLVRYARSQQAGFEIMGMDLDSRSRLRRLLVSVAGAPAPPQPVLAN